MLHTRQDEAHESHCNNVKSKHEKEHLRVLVTPRKEQTALPRLHEEDTWCSEASLTEDLERDLGMSTMVCGQILFISCEASELMVSCQCHLGAAMTITVILKIEISRILPCQFNLSKKMCLTAN